MNKVTSAVISLSGLGIRMLSLTEAIRKVMLALAGNLLIQYVVNECVAVGITKMVLVTHSSKTPLETTLIPRMSLNQH